MLTCHQWAHLVFILWQYLLEYSWYQSPCCVWNLLIWNHRHISYETMSLACKPFYISCLVSRCSRVIAHRVLCLTSHVVCLICPCNRRSVLRIISTFTFYIHYGMSPWQSWLGLLSLSPILRPSYCSSFESEVPVDFIYTCLIFKWIAVTWLHDRAPR